MNYIHWQRYPFVRILPALLAGIFIGSLIAKIPLIVLLIVLFVGLFTFGFAPITKTAKSCLLHGCIFTLGFTLAVIQSPKMPIMPNSNSSILATIMSDMEEKNKTFKTEAKIVYHDSSDQSITTKAIFYLQKTEEAKGLRIGDKIIVNTTFQPIQKPIIPGAFDYKKFMSSKGIFYSAYIKTENWVATDNFDRSLLIQRMAASKRIQFSKIIDRNVNESARGLVKAISIGQKTDLDKDTKIAFSKAGIMHVLAVSGLHVGIVWSIIAFAFHPLRKRKPSLKVATILIEVAAIWMFAFITGFAPSVQRAAFMFTLMAISKINQYEKDSVNLVIASAVMLLIFNTNLLFSVGFQLSYCAVLGIILLYPKIYKLVYCKNKWLDMIWQVQVVSLAAVIGTTPISLYYFNQFSLVFPVTNLLAIPAAYALVGLSIALFILSSIGWVANFIGISISFIADALIKTIDFISSFSFSAIDSIYINSIEFLLLTLLIFAIGIMIYQYHLTKKMMIASLILMNVIFLYRGSRKIISNQTIKQFTIQQKEVNKDLLKVGNKLFVINHMHTPSQYPIPLDGLERDWLVYKRENISSINLSEIKLQKGHIAATPIAENHIAN